MAKSKESISNERLLTAQEFNEQKFEPMIPLEATGISKNIIAFWRREGLMPFMEKGKWAKLSFVETIWLFFLESLRNLGLPVSTLKRVTDYFIKRAYDNDLPKQNLQYNKTLLEKKELAKTISPHEKIILEHINSTLNNPTLLYLYKWDINYFSNLITEIVTFGLEGGIMIFEDDTIAVNVYGSYQTFPEKELDLRMPHIYISMMYYLEVFIEKEELYRFLSKVHMLNEDEQRVIREVRNKNIQEVTIVFKNDKISKIEAFRTGIITKEKAKEIKKILGLGNYEKITIHTVDEKTISFKNTKIKYR